jgi:hypothetical protein
MFQHFLDHPQGMYVNICIKHRLYKYTKKVQFLLKFLVLKLMLWMPEF